MREGISRVTKIVNFIDNFSANYCLIFFLNKRKMALSRVWFFGKNIA